MGWSIFQQGVSATFGHIGGAIRATMLPLILAVAVHTGLLWALAPAPTPSETMPDEVVLLSTSRGIMLLSVLLIWWLAVLSTIALGWFRSLDGTRIGWVPSAPYGPIFKILNRFTLVMLVCLIILVFVGYPIRALTAPMVLGGAPWIALVVFVFLLMLMVYAVLRLGLGLPAGANGDRLGLLGSVTRTRSRSDPLILTAALVALVWCLAPAFGLAFPWLGPVGLVLQMVTLWVGYLVLLAILHMLLSEADQSSDSR